MSQGRPKGVGTLMVPTGIAELHEARGTGREVKTLSGMPLLPKEAVRDFKVEPGEHVGFKFLATFGPRAVRAFKILELAQSKAVTDLTAQMNASELALLTRLLGSDFVALAWRAYESCKQTTYDLATLDQLDERTTWLLSEMVHLFENVMTHGHREGILSQDQAGRVLSLLVRDFGAYYGLLVDDVTQTKRESVAALVKYLRAFAETPHYQRELPVDRMTRLPLLAPLSMNLLDYEIARGLAPHPIAVKERVIRGDDQGRLVEHNPVSYTSHHLTVFYSRDLDDEGRAIVNAILPVFAVSTFDGFFSLEQVAKYLTSRRNHIRQAEQECFALLQCLHHYDGQVPPTLKEFQAADVMKAAQQVYRERSKADRSAQGPKSNTLKARLSDTLGVTKPITFSWPADRTVVRLTDYPENFVFFAQNATLRLPGRPDEQFTFLCHARKDIDPHLETPLMFEYQVVLSDSQLLDAYAALRNGFANVPDTFRRTLDAGPVIRFAKETLFSGTTEEETELREVRLMGTYMALNGGMRSWVGQHYLLSTSQGNVFMRFPDVREYLAQALPSS